MMRCKAIHQRNGTPPTHLCVNASRQPAKPSQTAKNSTLYPHLHLLSAPTASFFRLTAEKSARLPERLGGFRDEDFSAATVTCGCGRLPLSSSATQSTPKSCSGWNLAI